MFFATHPLPVLPVIPVNEKFSCKLRFDLWRSRTINGSFLGDVVQKTAALPAKITGR
jgi:hypothetical protein